MSILTFAQNYATNLQIIFYVKRVFEQKIQNSAKLAVKRSANLTRVMHMSD